MTFNADQYLGRQYDLTGPTAIRVTVAAFDPSKCVAGQWAAVQLRMVETGATEWIPVAAFLFALEAGAIEEAGDQCEYCGKVDCPDAYEFACAGKRYAMVERAQDRDR